RVASAHHAGTHTATRSASDIPRRTVRHHPRSLAADADAAITRDRRSRSAGDWNVPHLLRPVAELPYVPEVLPAPPRHAERRDCRFAVYHRGARALLRRRVEDHSERNRHGVVHAWRNAPVRNAW